MADSNVDIINDPNDPNAQKNAPGAGTPTGAAGSPQAPSGATGSSTPSGGGAGASGSASQSGGAKAGTGFVNLQNVLNANKQGGQNLGNVIGSGIQQASSDVGQGLGAAQSSFGQAAAAGTVGGAADTSSRDAILNSISGYQAPATTVNTVGSGTPGASTTVPAAPAQNNVGGTANASGIEQLIGQTQTTADGSPAPATPAAVAAPVTPPTMFGSTNTPLAAGLTQQNLTDFGRLSGGVYTGPQGLNQATADQLQQQATAAQQMGQNVGSAGGQQALLQQFIGQGKGNYSTGEQGLDQLLLGQGGMNPLQQAKQSTMGLTGNVAGATQAAQEQAKYNTAQSAQFGADTKAALAGASTPIMDAITASQQAAVAKDNAINQTGTDITNSFNPTADALAKAAVNDSSWATGSQSIPLLQAQGLLNSDQSSQLTKLMHQGFIDPNDHRNDAYNAAVANPTGASQIVDTSKPTPTLTNQQAMQQGLILADPTGSLAANPNATYVPDGMYNKQPPPAYLTNQQALARGGGEYGQQYTNLSALGLKTGDLLGSEFQNVGGNAATIGNAGFVDPTQAAKLNALAQLGGQQNNALTQNMPTYQQSANTFNYDGLMNKINTAETNYEKAPTQAAYQQSNQAGGLGGFLTSPGGAGVSGGIPGIGYGGAAALFAGGKFDPNLGSQINSGVGNLFNNIGSLFSDVNLKQDIKSGNSDTQDFLDSLKPYSYNYKNQDHGKGQQLSVMAQDLEKTSAGKSAIEERPEGKAVNYSRLQAIMLASQAQLNQRLKMLETKKK